MRTIFIHLFAIFQFTRLNAFQLHRNTIQPLKRHAVSLPHFAPRNNKVCQISSDSIQDTTSTEKTTLTDSTTWKIRFVMNGIMTASGRRVDELLFAIDAQFLEEDGYEPPQGTLRQVYTSVESDNLDNDNDSLRTSELSIANGRWQLSEDPEDRKDGLWVWGLFKEPLYPFLLLQLETKPIKLPGDDNDTIGPLKLYAQISHIRDKEKGVILKASTLNIREMETVKADIFGGATVDVYEEVNVGQLNIQPL